MATTIVSSLASASRPASAFASFVARWSSLVCGRAPEPRSAAMRSCLAGEDSHAFGPILARSSVGVAPTPHASSTPAKAGDLANVAARATACSSVGVGWMLDFGVRTAEEVEGVRGNARAKVASAAAVKAAPRSATRSSGAGVTGAGGGVGADGGGASPKSPKSSSAAGGVGGTGASAKSANPSSSASASAFAGEGWVSTVANAPNSASSSPPAWVTIRREGSGAVVVEIAWENAPKPCASAVAGGTGGGAASKSPNASSSSIARRPDPTKAGYDATTPRAEQCSRRTE